jgi:hypothetical protein
MEAEKLNEPNTRMELDDRMKSLMS